MSQDNTNQKIHNKPDRHGSYLQGSDITNNVVKNWKRNNHPEVCLSKLIMFPVDLVFFFV